MIITFLSNRDIGKARSESSIRMLSKLVVGVRCIFETAFRRGLLLLHAGGLVGEECVDSYGIPHICDDCDVSRCLLSPSSSTLKLH